jgi:adenylate cyclase
MGIEIERRFLVQGEIPEGEVSPIAQAYLSVDPDRTMRVRLAGEKAWLTVKGRLPGLKWTSEQSGLSATQSSEPGLLRRLEFEYEIPRSDASEMFNMGLGAAIHKSRVRVPASGRLTWEIDVFYGENEGLVVAEIELEDEEQSFDRPDWLGDELTGDPRLTNATLVMNPLASWAEKEREPFVRRRFSIEELGGLSRFHLGLRPVSELDLSVRGANFLANRDIVSIGQLLNASDSELLGSGGFTKKSMNEIRGRLDEIELGLVSW